MYRYLFFLVLFCFVGCFSSGEDTVPVPLTPEQNDGDLYSEMGLSDLIDECVFKQAITGYRRVDCDKKGILTLIDFSKPSSEKRFFVLDLYAKRVLFASYVAHGRNSGGNFATSFSNVSGSYKSSLGFYLTEGTYYGKNGYSLVLNGLEKGINDRAKERAIVVHGASYAEPSVIASSGRLGRSLGCPALPLSVSREIIDAIKEGSLLYIYADNQDYLASSPILNLPTIAKL